MAQQLPITLTEKKSFLTLEKKGLLRLLFAAMRPHQWTKNLFIFAPLLFGRKLTESSAIFDSLIAFAVFCLLASGLYIFNDWLDIDEDRAHPQKRLRPLASGVLPVAAAVAFAGFLCIIAFALAAVFINLKFLLIAGVYFALTLAYCLVLKRKIVIDCMTIAAGFVLRVIGGAFAVGVVPTHWLIACAFLLALFLAFTKRRQEILTLQENAAAHRAVLNLYTIEYLDKVNNILIGAAIVCYALYTVAPETVARFQTDWLIYGTGFVIYGMFRYLALVKDAGNGGSPTRLLLRDRPLALTVAGWAFYNAAVIYQTALQSVWLSLFK
jgi:4-hydroxybenzoate polyprenyltransferase